MLLCCLLRPPLFLAFLTLSPTFARAASATITRLLATVVSDPSFESTATCALVTELVDFAATRRLDYVASIITESESVCPLSDRGKLALGCDVLEDRQFVLECLTARRSRAMDAEMVSSKSAGTYVDKVPPPVANIPDDMWIFIGKRPSGSPPAFKPRYVARAALLQNWHDVNLHCWQVALLQCWHGSSTQRWQAVDHAVLAVDHAVLAVSLHEDMWLRRPLGFTRSFPEGTQWSLRQPVYNLRQAPREWHDTLRRTLVALGFAPSTASLSLFLRTDPTLPPLYILVYVNNLVFATADTEALTLVKAELQKRHTFTDLGELRSYLGLQVTRERARRTITVTQSQMVQQQEVWLCSGEVKPEPLKDPLHHV
ncbi:unnamed protein product [Closterium sp. NIES-53]